MKKKIRPKFGTPLVVVLALKEFEVFNQICQTKTAVSKTCKGFQKMSSSLKN